MSFDKRAIEIGLSGISCTEDFDFRKNTTIGIGGKAALALFPGSADELERAVRFLIENAVPFCILGRGANVLASDRGFSGVAVCTRSVRQIHFLQEDVYCGCGADFSEIIALSERKGLGGIEFMAGIPATAGGAVFMNAGAQGQYIASAVKYVDVFECGKRLRIPTKECDFSYKCSRFMKRNSIVLGVCLHLKGMETQKIESSLDRVKAARNRLPKGRSMGCVFKNPSSISAGALIEQAGLKGVSHGDAIISDEHANFIINRGNATAEDVRYLIDLAKEQVYKRTGVLLEEEIRYIGDF